MEPDFSGWATISNLSTGDFRKKRRCLTLEEDTNGLIWYFRTPGWCYVRGTGVEFMEEHWFDDIPYSALLQDY